MGARLELVCAPRALCNLGRVPGRCRRVHSRDRVCCLLAPAGRAFGRGETEADGVGHGLVSPEPGRRNHGELRDAAREVAVELELRGRFDRLSRKPGLVLGSE